MWALLIISMFTIVPVMIVNCIEYFGDKEADKR